MRAFLACSVAFAMVLVVFACSDDTRPGASSSSSSSSGGTDGATVLADGAIVGPDGEVVTPDTAKPSKVDVTTESVSVASSLRDYILAVPKTYSAAKTYPLVLVFHGDGGDATSMRGYHTVDDETGDDAVVAYLSGTAATWDLTTAYADNADQQYVQAVIDALKVRLSIDASKVFGVGYSSGAFLASQLACRKSMFRGIVIHSGGAPFEVPPTNDADGYQSCAGSPKVATLVMHGTADTTVAPSSGDFAAKFWAHANACDPDNLAPVAPSPCRAHASCPTGLPVHYCLVEGLGHVVWPQAIPVEWAFLKAL